MPAETLPLFYPERLNSIFGESGGGKTWIAYAAVVETVQRGGRVVVIDWEDSMHGIVERLDLLGVEVEHIALVDYRNPGTGIARGVERLAEDITEPVALIIIDSVGEAMAAGGVNSNDDAEVAVWFNLCRRLCRLPGHPAVVLLDHIPKATDAPQLYSIGSQRKRAAINGASYRVDTLREPAQGRDGKWKLTVAKDRVGNRAKGTTAAIVDVTSTEGSIGLYFHMTEGGDTGADGTGFRPTNLMEKVSRFLDVSPGASGAVIERDVTGKSRSVIRTAVRCLVDEGFVRIEDGPRGSRFHYNEREFREMDGLIAPPRPTSPDLAPTSPGEVATPPDPTSPTSPPPEGARWRSGEVAKASGDHRPRPAETTTEAADRWTL